MKVVIDTSSLLSLVRYYLPFDRNGVLFHFVKRKIESKEFIILDKVYEESRFIAKGVVVEKLDYLTKKKNLTKTDTLLPSKKFYNQLDNQFINQGIRYKLDAVEFENRRNAFLNSADVKILLYGIQSKKNGLDPCSIVTEETATSNDNKSFKKIPAIGKMLDLEVFTLPHLISKLDGVDLIIR